MKHPEWATKHKVKGTELRLIKGKYYLYKITSKWDKKKKVTRKITLGLIGRITETEGLIPRGTRARKSIIERSIRTKEYGATHILINILGKDLVEGLQKDFPRLWQQILVLALQKLLNQSPLKNIEYYYQESYLSELYPELSLSKSSLTGFMAALGEQQEALLSFKKRLIQGSKHIVFDITHLLSQSNDMEINLQGYNSKDDFEPQVNLFYLFSTDLKIPVYYRVIPGNISGMNALRLTIDEAQLKDCIVIGDKGFGSTANIEKLESEGLVYILPLRRNSSFADYSKLQSSKYKESFDGHFFYHERPIFYSVTTKAHRHYIMYLDSKLRQQEEADYLLRIAKNYEGYDMDGFHEKQLSFGTVLMATNSSLSPEEVYQQYKSRMEVEAMFDTFKNTLQADASYMQSKESFESWVFINHIALILYYRLLTRIKQASLLKQYSPKDILIRLIRIQKIHIQGSWVTSEINAKTLKLLKTLELPVT
jgi:transposase